MLWIFFALAAALIWATVNVIDKFILCKLISKPVIPVLVLGLVSAVAGATIYAVHGLQTLSWVYLGLAIVGGFGYCLANWLYFKAVTVDDISRLVPLFHLTPLLIALLAAFTLGEVFTPIKYLGVVCLVAGALLISLKKITHLSVGPGFWFILLADCAIATTEVITKYLLNQHIDFWTVFAYVRLGTGLALVPYCILNVANLKALYKNTPGLTLSVIAANQMLNLTGIFFLTLASLIGYVTLVNAASSVQSLFVLLLATIISVTHASILKEETDAFTLLRKFVAILILLAGAVLVS